MQTAETVGGGDPKEQPDQVQTSARTVSLYGFLTVSCYNPQLLFRYTRDGRRYWRWKDVVARVLHICRGASADDYSLLLQTEHWLEACDSKHRYGSNLKPYFKVWLESDTQQSFFKWLDEGQGLHVDIEDRQVVLHARSNCINADFQFGSNFPVCCRPRSKLDADRVVYCGIERCFFEVTVVQGVFRYRISKRHVTTDSSRDQPPCPPNLGETMDSIRNSMLPQRMHSPPILGSQTVHCGIPASPSTPAPKRPAQLSEEARNISVRQEGVARESAVSEPVPAVHLSEIDLAAGPCIVQSRDSNQTLETHVQYESDACSAHGVDHPRQRDVLQSGRLSVDANNAGCRKRPGLLTQEFNRVCPKQFLVLFRMLGEVITCVSESMLLLHSSWYCQPVLCSSCPGEVGGG